MSNRFGENVTAYKGNCLDVLALLPSASVDCVITDPPYPHIKREYGHWTEAEWFALMDVVVPECRRILKPTGSAVFVLQPNSEKAGKIRPWLWDFMAKWTRQWGMVQDAWWWNTCTLPSGGAITSGLMRSSVKPCVWLGPNDCFRNQDAVLWEESQANATRRASAKSGVVKYSSEHRVDHGRCRQKAAERGGTTPFNVLPFAASNGTSGGDNNGHATSTPLPLCSWWLRYICPPGGTVLEPFLGSGTVALAAVKQGKRCIGIEKEARYFDIACARIEKELASTPLLDGVT